MQFGFKIFILTFLYLPFAMAEAEVRSFVVPPKKVVTIGQILHHNGFSKDQTSKIFESDSKITNSQLKPYSIYLVHKDAEANRTEVTLYSEDSDSATIIWREEKSAGYEVVDVHYDTEVAQIEGNVQKTFAESLFKLVPEKTIQEKILQSFENENMNRLPRKASFLVEVEKKYDHGVFVKYGRVLKAALDIGKEVVLKTIHPLSNSDYSLEAVELNNEDQPFFSPVDSFIVTSPFQQNRYHPITHRRKPHSGIDLGLPKGSAVFAPMSGEISFMGFSKTKGRFVMINHGNDYETSFIHLSKIDPKIQIGEKISVGQKIGEVGCTGQCTRPHLHFSIRKGLEYLNPIFLVKRYSYNQKYLYEGLDESDVQNLKSEPQIKGGKDSIENEEFEEFEENENVDVNPAKSANQAQFLIVNSIHAKS